MIERQRRFDFATTDDEKGISHNEGPKRIRLKGLKTIRSRAEVTEHKAGIVYKPRPHPLAGDSSLRSVQRAKKDASAALSVLRVSIATPPVLVSNTLLARLVLEITNPCPAPLRFELVKNYPQHDFRSFPFPLVPMALRRASFTVAQCHLLDQQPLGATLEAYDDDDDDEDGLLLFPPHVDVGKELDAPVVRAHRHLAFAVCDVEVEESPKADFYRVPLLLRQFDPRDTAVFPIALIFPTDRSQWPTCAYRAFL